MNKFYVAFWKKISKPVSDCYKSSQDVKSLSNSQRQATATLLEKAVKYIYLKNWKPISLLNLDSRLPTTVLGIRVKNVLPSIISDCHTGYVVNKSINDSIRIAQNIINYTEITQSHNLAVKSIFYPNLEVWCWREV